MVGRTFLCVLILGVAATAQTQGAPSQVTPKVGSDPGIIIVTFVLPNGAIYVNLPEDMSPGDTLSGSVGLDAHVATEPERVRNLAELSSYRVEVAGQKAGIGSFVFNLP